jgi:hypothetical protein
VSASWRSAREPGRRRCRWPSGAAGSWPWSSARTWPPWPAATSPLPAASDIPSSGEELDRSHRFGPATFRRYEWEWSYTTTSYVEVLLTYSGHRALDPRAQANLLDCIAQLLDDGYGGRIAKRYLTELRVASTVAP